MAEPSVKIELAAELERARARIARNVGALRQDLDVATHLKHNFHENKAAYLGGATFLGLVLSKLPTRKKKVYVETKSKQKIKEAEKAGMGIVALQFLFKTFRPMITSFLTKQVTEYVRSRSRPPEV